MMYEDQELLVRLDLANYLQGIKESILEVSTSILSSMDLEIIDRIIKYILTGELHK